MNSVVPKEKIAQSEKKQTNSDVEYPLIPVHVFNNTKKKLGGPGRT